MKILLAIDTSRASQDVICEAAVRPWPPATEFCVVHVVDVTGMAAFPALIEEDKLIGQSLVTHAVERLSRPGREISTEVLVGFPRKAVAHYAKEWGADLIMAGSHGQGAIARFLLGSVAQAMLRVAHCSVEIVRCDPKKPRSSGNPMKILLASDGSEYSLAAVKSVASRPWPAGSQVKLVSSVELLALGTEMAAWSSSPAYPESLLVEVWNEARSRARTAVAEARDVLKAAGMKIDDSDAAPEGDPRVVILNVAKEWGADLIVLGSHGWHGIDRVLMGSVSESVALHAHCSVEVIR
ncbi:MAG TPA: universal stress protein [Candidatus Acidoferrales bacterium]|nr:universal stress protein [Candidatus Acidoferrales bacterium]